MPGIFKYSWLIAGLASVLTAHAEPLYEYLTPNGVTLFTDVKLKAPFRLVNAAGTDSQGSEQLQAYQDFVGSKRQQYDSLIRSKAEKYALPAELVHAIIEAESAYMPDAVSTAGAVGMMQLMPKTAQRFGVSNLTDAAENIEGGTRYMRYLLDLYDSNLELAIASYNAGEEAVRRYNYQVPPYPETQQYVNRVMRYFERNL